MPLAHLKPNSQYEKAKTHWHQRQGKLPLARPLSARQLDHRKAIVSGATAVAETAINSFQSWRENFFTKRPKMELAACDSNREASFALQNRRADACTKWEATMGKATAQHRHADRVRTYAAWRASDKGRTYMADYARSRRQSKKEAEANAAKSE